jgi:hypothetical protein
MKAKTILLFLFISFLGMAPNSYMQQENLDNLRTQLDTAIKRNNSLETAEALGKLIKAGVDPKTLPLDKASVIISYIGSNSYSQRFDGEEFVQVLEPLEDIFDNTLGEHEIRSWYFWGLMDTGRRKKALELWRKSEAQMASLFDKPYPVDLRKLSREQGSKLRRLGSAYERYVVGFMFSKDQEDKLLGVELAKKYYDWILASVQENIEKIKLDHPAAKPQIKQLLTDRAYAQLVYALVKTGLITDPNANPFLKDQPETDIRFHLAENTGFEEYTPKESIDRRSHRRPIALADFDGDGYLDVLVTGKGLYRNLEGRGKFVRMDKELEVNINGWFGAFADVNNDSLVDLIIVGPGKFEVSLQTQKKKFQPVKEAASFDVVSQGMGLFDGDADGFIDVFISGWGSSGDKGGTPYAVLRNRGDGTFEDITEEWGFAADDTIVCDAGVSPGDYDNDGYIDIYVSNIYINLQRNVLWHNISEKNKPFFVECASAPWFGRGQRPEVLEGADRGVEGRHYIRAANKDWPPMKWPPIQNGRTYWAPTFGSAWGDINGDGTLDLVCANTFHPSRWGSPFLEISRVYLNTGSSFKDHTLEAGLVFRETNKDPLLADFNNDGALDLSITNSYVPYANQLYEGMGDGSFKEVTFRTGAFAFNAKPQAFGDFDNDGDLDWFVHDANRGILLFENKLIDKGKIPEKANWIQIKLIGGEQVNSMAYGARVTVRAKDKFYVREVAGMRGTSNCDDQVVHVGLGDYTGKVDVEVRWIADKVQKISGLDINRRHVITEGIEKMDNATPGLGYDILSAAR